MPRLASAAALKRRNLLLATRDLITMHKLVVEFKKLNQPLPIQAAAAACERLENCYNSLKGDLVVEVTATPKEATRKKAKES